MKPMQRLCAVICALLLTMTVEAQEKESHNFQVIKNLEIFNQAYKNLDMMFVDTLNPEHVINSAMKGMLSQMDPYTEYFPNDNEYKKSMEGGYAGIGATIHYSFKQKNVVVDEPFEGSPAAKAGLKKGDVILAIDKDDMQGKEVSFVSSHLRGEAGTTFMLKILRKGKTLKMKITREAIKAVATIPYYGLHGDVGYLNLSSFVTEDCSKEVRRAYIDLRNRGAKKFIIDLRNNGGGLLNEAIDMVNMFVPKGLDIVEMRGKVERANYTYSTTVEPIDTLMPLVVLVNRSSASASEIFAGAMQDLDRAVVMGQRTYGKGLVQRTFGMPYGGNLKLTVAKYYIPSGRCIQAINYNRSDKARYEKDDIPDSLTTAFHTRNGREVRDGRGIKPDVEIKVDTISNVCFYLTQIVDSTDVYFNWVNDYCQSHPTIASPADFEISDADYADFRQKVIDSGFKYDRISSEYMKKFKESAKLEGYYDDAKAEIDALEKKLQTGNIGRELDKHEDEIRQTISQDIISSYYFQRGATEYTLRHDKTYLEAVRLLNDTKRYNEILQPSQDKDTGNNE